MSRFFNRKFAKLTPYTPGEQPQERQYVKLNTNESPFPPSPFAQKLAREAVGDLQLYSDPNCGALVRIAAQQFGLNENEIAFFNSSDEALNFSFMAFCEEDRPVVFADITYGFYPVFCELNGLPYETIPLRKDLTVCVEDYIGINKTIFIANPNAPTGIALSRDDIERIVASNPNHVVVVDEAYVDFGAESCVPLTRKYDNVLVCQTFSKSRSMAGARLGFAIGNPQLIADLNTIRFSTNPYNVNRVSMAAGIGALCDTAYFERNCKAIAETRESTAKRLKEFGFTMTPSVANFMFIKHDVISGLELYQKLKEKGVLIRHFETDLLKDYNRVSIGSAEQMDVFLTEVRNILEAIV